MSKSTSESTSESTFVNTFPLAGRQVHRVGYGAMQLAGPGVFGPPKDRDAAIAVLREAVASGANHIDTSDFYGPHITNQLIREALHPYADELVIVTKVGAVRGEDGSWLAALEPEDIQRAVYDNLRNLGLDVLDIVNLRNMGNIHSPAEGSIEKQGRGTCRTTAPRSGASHRPEQCDLNADHRGAAPRADRLRSESIQSGPARRRCAGRRTGGQGHRLCAVLPAWRVPRRSNRRRCPKSPKR